MATIPYLSQWRDISDEEWAPRACGVVCAAMLLRAHGIEATPDELLAEARAMKGHLAWTSDGIPHATLCGLFRNRGLHSYHEEFRGRRFDAVLGRWQDDLALDRAHLDFGLAKIRESVTRGEPCLVSMAAGFRTNRESHLIAVVDTTADSGFVVHDPDDRSGSGESVEVPLDRFEEFFRRLVVFCRR
ncbi:MAG TPA: C39 family peptidase [Candidatus Paceibacterota bacterium]